MDEHSTISVGDAYRAMFEFVDAFWRRGGKQNEEIAAMLGSIQYSEELGPTKTADPAQWQDWLDAVGKVTK